MIINEQEALAAAMKEILAIVDKQLLLYPDAIDKLAATEAAVIKSIGIMATGMMFAPNRQHELKNKEAELPLIRAIKELFIARNNQREVAFDAEALKQNQKDLFRMFGYDED